MTTETRAGALAGYRIVEIAAGVAVSYCAELFAQCGAEVIRIESPAGDELRRLGPFTADRPDLESGGAHRVLNGGKRSVALDIQTETGARFASAIIKSADVLVTSWRANSLLPLSEPDHMTSQFPDLTYVSISPFGRTGPYAEYEADGLTVEALAGMAYISGEPDQPPVAMGVELTDYMAGANGFLMGAAALAARLRDEQHHFIDVSSFEAIEIADDYTLSFFLGSGKVRGRYYSRVPMMYPCDIFECADGYVAFMNATAVGRDFGTALAVMLDRPELADLPLFADPKRRVVRWREFDALVSPWFRERSVAAANARAAEVGIDLSPVLSVEDLLDDKHLRARAFFRRLADGEVTMGAPFRMSRTPLRLGLPPTLGADNESLLGVTPEQNTWLWQD